METRHGLDRRIWNRRFLLCFFYAHLLAFLSEELFVLTSGLPFWYGQLHYVVLPIGINLSVLLLVELMIKRFPKLYSYLTLFAVVIMCAVFVAVHPGMDYIQALLLLPVMLSSIYYRRAYIVFTSILSIVCFLLLTWLVPGLRERTDPDEWLSLPFFIGIAATLAWVAMIRGNELLRELREETKDKEHLMIQNVLMDQMVRLDPMTGLYNRSALSEHLDNLFTYANRDSFSLILAMVDIDHFKSINDTFGHIAGDAVLRRVSRLLRDNMAPGDFVARYGGEEFTIVFTERSRKDAMMVLEKIRRDAESHPHEELNGRPVTLSIGLCPFFRGMSKEMLLDQADARLYQAKREGRNRIVG